MRRLFNCRSVLLVCLITGPLGMGTPRARVPTLPAGVRAGLNARAPGWRLAVPDAEVVDFAKCGWGARAEELAVLRGDFDGNGQADYAVHIACGPSATQRRLIVFFGRGTRYEQRVLDSGEWTGQRYLRLARRGMTGRDYATDRPITFRYDTVQMNTFEKGGRSFVYQRGRFRAIVTSD